MLGETPTAEPSQPSTAQLKKHFVQSMVPMIGFGFMDNTVMIHAGNAIDLTLGVTFGLSTMSAAACGQICSDVAGVSFGGVIDAAARKLGLPAPEFTQEQLGDPIVKRIGLLGSIVGVFCGCSLGLTNLFFIDSSQKELKLAAGDSNGEDFFVSISNEEREDATSITIDGPAKKGLLASVLQALVAADCSLYEIHADSVPMGEFKHRQLFVRKEGDQVDDSDLHALALAVLAAARKPDTNNKMLLRVEALQTENEDLRKQLQQLEERLEAQSISVSKRSETRKGPS